MEYKKVGTRQPVSANCAAHCPALFARGGLALFLLCAPAARHAAPKPAHLRATKRAPGASRQRTGLAHPGHTPARAPTQLLAATAAAALRRRGRRLPSCGPGSRSWRVRRAHAGHGALSPGHGPKNAGAPRAQGAAHLAPAGPDPGRQARTVPGRRARRGPPAADPALQRPNLRRGALPGRSYCAAGGVAGGRVSQGQSKSRRPQIAHRPRGRNSRPKKSRPL